MQKLSYKSEEGVMFKINFVDNILDYFPRRNGWVNFEWSKVAHYEHRCTQVENPGGGSMMFLPIFWEGTPFWGFITSFCRVLNEERSAPIPHSRRHINSGW